MPVEETAVATPTTPDASKVTPATTPGQMPTTTATPSDTVELKDLPESWQREIKAARKEAADLRKKEQDRIDADKLKQDEELKAQNKWQQIAEEREKEVSRLKPLEADNLELTDLVRDYINDQIKAWPKEVQDTAPKGEVSAKALVEWANSHRALAEKLMESTVSQKPTPKPGNPIGPTPSSIGNKPAGSGNEEPLVNVRI